jgi:hypothetical protein
LYSLTFEKAALLEKSTFQPPANVKEFGLGLWSLVRLPSRTGFWKSCHDYDLYVAFPSQAFGRFQPDIFSPVTCGVSTEMLHLVIETERIRLFDT